MSTHKNLHVNVYNRYSLNHQDLEAIKMALQANPCVDRQISGGISKQ